MSQKQEPTKAKIIKDNDDKVLVANYRSGGYRKYHEDPDCKYVTENHEVWDIDLADAWDVEPCKGCTNPQI